MTQIQPWKPKLYEFTKIVLSMYRYSRVWKSKACLSSGRKSSKHIHTCTALCADPLTQKKRSV